MPRLALPRSLFARTALVLVVLLVLLGLFGVARTSVTTRLFKEEVEQQLNRELAGKLLGEGPLMLDGEVQDESLEHLLHMLMVINPRLEIYVLGTEGDIRAYSAEEGRVKLDRVSLEPVRRLLAADAKLPIRGDDPRHPGRRKVFSVAPIESDTGDLQGYLYVVLGGEHYDAVAALVRESFILRLSVIWGIVAIVILTSLGILVFHRLTGRLRGLDRKVRRYRAEGEGLADESSGRGPGGGDGPASDADTDEIGRLEASLDEMRRRIDRQVEEIGKVDRLRRELIANVSHDLRTPLATLQGYLETLMLKGTGLSAEERAEYLEIAHRQSETLGRLVDELFELARLDSGDSELEVEPFSAADLVQDVLGKFRFAAEEKGVRLDAELPSERSPLVTGDLRLIERVLDNLLENALRHTPEGGVIKVALDDSPAGVEVRVTDTGSGISGEDLPRIFDRFYRGDAESVDGRAAGAHARGGAGLGLAIAQRIVELHGSTIHADSSLGRGSTFSFQLAGVGPLGGDTSAWAGP